MIDNNIFDSQALSIPKDPLINGKIMWVQDGIFKYKARVFIDWLNEIKTEAVDQEQPLELQGLFILR